jgi:outer membrane protein assembly factor BamB
MSSRLTQYCLLLSCMSLLGCARVHPVERVVASAIGSVSSTPTVQAAAPEALSWARRTGLWTGPGPLARPEIQWTNRLAGPVIHPLSTDGSTVYVVAGGQVYALELSGIKRWTARIQASGPVVVTDAGLLVPREDGRVALLDPGTGEVLKQTETAGPIGSAPIMLEGVIAWVTSDGIFATSDGGRLRVVEGALTGIASDGSRVFVGAKSGLLFALDRSGIIWQASLPGPPIAHPVLGDADVVIAFTGTESSSGGVAAFSQLSGEQRWSAELSTGAAAAPALGELVVLPGRDAELIGLDPGHGGVRWKTPGGASFSTQPALTQGSAYAGNADGRLHRIDQHDGGEAWSIQLGAGVTGEPVIIGEQLIVGLSDGRLVSVR